MRRIRAMVCLTMVLGMAVRAADAAVTPQVIPFDRAFMVASPGSTEPVSEFSIEGPAPVLYLDLPSPRGQYSSASGTWFADSSTTAKFSLSGGALFSSDEEFWITPSPEEWQLKKSVGGWHVNANYSWWTLVIIYGGGAPVTYATGSQVVPFTVTATGPPPISPVNPEPGSLLLSGISAAALLLTRRRRT
jgi:hypothetical protein